MRFITGRKNLFLTICFFLIVENEVFSQSIERVETPASCHIPRLSSENFVLEEETVFSIYWYFYLGDIGLKTESQIINGKKLYKFSINMQTQGIVDYWYPFHYRIVSYTYGHQLFLPFFSYFFEKNSDERSETAIEYDRRRNRSCYKKQETDYEDGREWFEEGYFVVRNVNDPSGNLRDILNALFYMRTISDQDLFDSRKRYLLLEKTTPILGRISFLREEIIRLGDTNVETFVVRLNFQRMENSNKKNRFRNITAWMTKKRQRVIVKVTLTVREKNLRGFLERYQRYPSPSN